MQTETPLTNSISIFPHINQFNQIDRTILEALHDIKTSAVLKTKIEQLREIATTASKKEINNYKVSELPDFQFGGLFEGGHKIANLIKASGFIISDIDNLTFEEAEILRTKFGHDKYCFFAFISPTGKGVKAGFYSPFNKSESDNNRFFVLLSSHIKLHYGFDIDAKCTDISRACFASFDAGLVVNQTALSFPLPEFTETPQVKPQRTFTPLLSNPSDNYTSEEIYELLRYVPIGKAGTGTYINLFNVGVIFKDIFGIEGARGILENWAFSRAEDIEKPLKWQGSGKHPLTIATIIKTAQDNGLPKEWHIKRLRRIEPIVNKAKYENYIEGKAKHSVIGFYTTDLPEERKVKDLRQITSFVEIVPSEDMKFHSLVLYPNSSGEYKEAEECCRRMLHRCTKVSIDRTLLDKKPISATPKELAILDKLKEELDKLNNKGIKRIQFDELYKKPRTENLSIVELIQSIYTVGLKTIGFPEFEALYKEMERMRECMIKSQY